MNGQIQDDEQLMCDDFAASSAEQRADETGVNLQDEPKVRHFMTLVDPMIDKASLAGDDSDIGATYDDEVESEAQSPEALTDDLDDLDDLDSLEKDVDDSEFDDDIQFDQLDEFMADDADDVDELVDLDSDLDDGLDELDELGELKDELDVPLTASQQALAARRAIEERAEARRMERDLNYLDFELDD